MSTDTEWGMCSLEDDGSLYDPVSCSEKTLFLGNLRTGAMESLVWLPVSVIPVLRMQRQEDHEFETSLNCTVRPHLKETEQNKNKTKKQREKKGEGKMQQVH